MKKSNKIVAVLLALVMIISAVPMMTVLAAEEHTHEYVLQDGSTEATCTTDGQATYKCSCGDVKVAVTEALGHKLVGTYTVKDDVHSKYCDRCKKTIEYEHNYRFDVPVDERIKEPTCKEEGVAVFKCSCGKKATKPVEKVAHTFTTIVKNGENHTGECSVCKATITEAHTWDEGTVTKEAKCHADGEMTYTCTACAATKTEKIEKGHKMTETATKVDAKDHKFECEKGCGHTEKKAHDFVVTVVLAPTCQTKGTMVVTCKECDYLANEVIAKAKHTFGNYEKYDADKHTQKCTICGVESYGDHTWNEGTVTTEPTCAKEGVKTYLCKICNQKKTEAIAKTTEHTWGEWEVVEEATTEKEGKKTRKCSVCEATETEKIDKLTANLGDVNGDGKVTAVDARIVLQNVAGLKTLTEKEKEAADMNADGNITAVDARVILQKVAAGE